MDQIRRVCLVVYASMVAIACSGNTVAPQPDAAGPLADGRYDFSVRAPVGFAGCSTAWESLGLSSRVITVRVTHQSGESIARSEGAGSDDFELRIRENGRASTGTSVTGTVRGTAVTVIGFTGFPGLSVSFGSGSNAAQVTGTAFNSSLSPTSGQVSGSVLFVDGAHPPLNCSAADWMLNQSLF